MWFALNKLTMNGKTIDEYVKWLERMIEMSLEDKDLQREHWAFCQALSKYRELNKI
jgi:hypothetical protein